jgi:hypothetical protein
LISNLPSPEALVPDFWARLAELGYIDGKNLVKEERFAVGDSPIFAPRGEGFAGPFADFAAELARLPVDVIAVTGVRPPPRPGGGATTKTKL